MPASRIAFAFADVLKEVRSLLPPDQAISMDVRLSPDAYKAVTDEMAYHFQISDLKRTPIADLSGTGEWTVIGGVRFTTMLSTSPVGLAPSVPSVPRKRKAAKAKGRRRG